MRDVIVSSVIQKESCLLLDQIILIIPIVLASSWESAVSRKFVLTKRQSEGDISLGVMGNASSRLLD